MRSLPSYQLRARCRSLHVRLLLVTSLETREARAVAALRSEHPPFRRPPHIGAGSTPLRAQVCLSRLFDNDRLTAQWSQTPARASENSSQKVALGVLTGRTWHQPFVKASFGDRSVSIRFSAVTCHFGAPRPAGSPGRRSSPAAHRPAWRSPAAPSRRAGPGSRPNGAPVPDRDRTSARPRRPGKQA